MNHKLLSLCTRRWSSPLQTPLVHPQRTLPGWAYTHTHTHTHIVVVTLWHEMHGYNYFVVCCRPTHPSYSPKPLAFEIRVAKQQTTNTHTHTHTHTLLHDINWGPQDAWSSGPQLMSKLVRSCRSGSIAPPS